MDKIDWDAVFTALVEAAVVMIVASFVTIFFLFALILGMLVSVWLYYGFMFAALAVLTKFFYKYESSVNEEDNE
jgi:hypothetical protein